jgi:uncharacterized membrane protein
VGAFSSHEREEGFFFVSHPPRRGYTNIDFPLGATETQAYGINNQGQTVGLYVDAAAGNFHGFLLVISAAGILVRAIDVPGGFLTRAFGINGAGKIVGSYIDKKTGKFRGFLATQVP